MAEPRAPVTVWAEKTDFSVPLRPDEHNKTGCWQECENTPRPFSLPSPTFPERLHLRFAVSVIYFFPSSLRRRAQNLPWGDAVAPAPDSRGDKSEPEHETVVPCPLIPSAGLE